MSKINFHKSMDYIPFVSIYSASRRIIKGVKSLRSKEADKLDSRVEREAQIAFQKKKAGIKLDEG